MNGRRMTDAQISKALRAHLPDRVYPGLRDRILDAAETTGQQRALPPVIGALSDADPVVRRRSLLIAAALLVALALASFAAVGALRLLQHDPLRDLTFEPPADVTAPSVTPTASSPAASSSPNASAALLTWTQASLHEDWPAPVRPEPGGAATVVPILLKDVVDNPGAPLVDQRHTLRSGRYTDPSGDTGSAALPWADIKEVTICGVACLSIGPVSGFRSAVDPTEQWIAYGIVADTDGDGVPDRRYGFDNMPVGATGSWPHRWWITDLHTGRTEWASGPPYGIMVGKTEFYGGPGRLTFGADVTGGGTVGGLPERFYVWASVIQDGRVVSTDYAPDVGWLHPSPDAKP
jgi:hypothetical protein